MTLGQFRRLTESLTDEAEIRIADQEIDIAHPTKAKLDVYDGSIYVLIDIETL